MDERSGFINMEILAYLTSHEGEVLSGNALCLFIKDEEVRQQMIVEICRALDAKAVQLMNGDCMIVDA